jgi:hypothetical protein
MYLCLAGWVHRGPIAEPFAWVVDPDGNNVELWEPKTWDWKNKAG